MLSKSYYYCCRSCGSDAVISLLSSSLGCSFLTTREKNMQDGNKESFCILNFTMALGKGEASNKNSFRGTLWVGVLPRWLSGKESASKCRRCKRRGCDPWVGESPWRRKWQPTLVSLPGKSQGWRSLEGYSPQGCKRVRYNLAPEQ